MSTVEEKLKMIDDLIELIDGEWGEPWVKEGQELLKECKSLWIKAHENEFMSEIRSNVKWRFPNESK